MQSDAVHSDMVKATYAAAKRSVAYMPIQQTNVGSNSTRDRWLSASFTFDDLDAQRVGSLNDVACLVQVEHRGSPALR